jgi:hypothetical protein
MEAGASITHFEGQIGWEGLTPMASAHDWNWTQVMAIYLMPYVGMMLLFSLLSRRRQHPINVPGWLLILRNWLYILTLLWVAYMPIWDILTQNGLYFAFTWLSISTTVQFSFGILMLVFFIIKLFRVAALFSASLILKQGQYVPPKQITTQLIYMWYLPLLTLSIILIAINHTQPRHPYTYYLSGLLLALLTNTWLIRKYTVIVK